MHRRKMLVSVVLMTGFITMATATGASAAPSANSSCAAKYVHALRPPGHGGPVGGDHVSLAARIPKDECFPPPFPTD